MCIYIYTILQNNEVNKPKRKKVYSPLDLINGKSTRGSYKQTKKCYITRIDTNITNSGNNIETNKKWNRNF